MSFISIMRICCQIVDMLCHRQKKLPKEICRTQYRRKKFNTCVCQFSDPKIVHKIQYVHPEEAAVLGVTHRVCGFEFVIDADIEVTLVLVVGLVLNHTGENFSLLHGKDITQIEDSLLPVGVPGMRASGKADGLVACGEVNVEPSNQGVDKVVALGRKREGSLESEVRGLDGVKIEGDDRARVADNSLELDGIDERLCKGNVLHGAVVKSPHVVPN